MVNSSDAVILQCNIHGGTDLKCYDQLVESDTLITLVLGKNYLMRWDWNDTTFQWSVFVNGTVVHDDKNYQNDGIPDKFDPWYIDGSGTYNIDAMYYINNSVATEGRCPQEQPPETIPILSNINCTSFVNGSLFGDVNEPYNTTGDLTPSFKFITDVNANCIISDVNTSYDDCQTTGNKNHECTLQWNRSLVVGNDKVYINCTGQAGLVGYDDWDVWTGDPTVVSDPQLVQYIEVDNYTDTNITFNRTIFAIAYNNTEVSFDVPTLDGWTLKNGTDPILVQPTSTNYAVYQNVSQRGASDMFLDLAAVTTTEMVATSNKIRMIVPVDPPLKSCVFKTSRSLSGISLTCDTLQVWDDVILDMINSTNITADLIEIGDTGNITIQNRSHLN